MVIGLCKYKDALGKIGTGSHSYRIGNIAINDVIKTIILAYILSLIFRTNFWYTLIVVFIIGIILHRIFCVRTTIDKFLFP